MRHALAARFLDDLAVERIVLYALDGPAKLLSLRTAKLPAWVTRELDAADDAAIAAEAAAQEAAAEQEGEDGRSEGGSDDEEGGKAPGSGSPAASPGRKVGCSRRRKG